MHIVPLLHANAKEVEDFLLVVIKSLLSLFILHSNEDALCTSNGTQLACIILVVKQTKFHLAH